MEKYDGQRSLSAFLKKNIINRLINMRRNKFHRNDAPCKACFRGEFCSGSAPCEVYSKWKARNVRKATLMSTADTSGEYAYSNTAPATFLAKLDVEYIESIFNKRLTPPQRKMWLKIKDGVRIPRGKYNKFVKLLQNILAEEGVDIAGAG